MVRSVKDSWWDVPAVLVGIVGGLVMYAVFAIILRVFLGFSAMDLVVTISEGVLSAWVGALIWSFLLTALFPRSSDTGLSIGYPFAQILIGGLHAMDYGWTTFAGFLVLAAVAYGSGRLGVRMARQFGPQWCRLDNVIPPEEPACPACGYVLYFAEGQKCPECGREFRLDELDMRLARWDGRVITPHSAEFRR